MHQELSKSVLKRVIFDAKVLGGPILPFFGKSGYGQDF
jgi:hypothetical protein